jgi:hypothetical protein
VAAAPLPPTPQLFFPSAPPPNVQDPSLTVPVVRRRYVTISIDTLTNVIRSAAPVGGVLGALVPLPLFSDTDFFALVSGVSEPTGRSAFTLSAWGIVLRAGRQIGSFNLSLYGNQVSLYVVLPAFGVYYDLEPVIPLESSVHVIYQAVSSTLPSKQDMVLPRVGLSASARPRPGSSAQNGLPQKAASVSVAQPPVRAAATTNAVIDVQVVYTPAAANNLGGVSGLLSEVSREVNDANVAYTNSGISQQINLLPPQPVNFTESANIQSDWRQLSAGTGVFSGVRELRDEVGADLVMMFGWGYNPSQGCGIATQNDSQSADQVYGIADAYQGCANTFILAHELGHLMGTHHDRAHDSIAPPPGITYSYGRLNPAQGWHTVMSYPQDPGCPNGYCLPIDYFANPNVLYNGVPTGIADSAANAADDTRRLNELASVTANYRCRGWCPFVAQTLPPPGITGRPAISSRAVGRLDSFARGTDNNLWHQTYLAGGGWSAWENLGAPPGGVVSEPTAVSGSADRVDVFTRGADGTLMHLWWDGTRWNGWQSLGATLSSAPGAASMAPGRLDVFFAGTDNALYHRWFVLADGKWYGDERLGGTLSPGAPAVSAVPNRLDVVARFTDSHLWHSWWDGTRWNPWEDLGGAFPSEPAMASWGPGHIDIFARYTDNGLWQRSWNGTSWMGWQSIAANITSDPTAVSWGSGRIDLALAQNSSLFYRSYIS